MNEHIPFRELEDREKGGYFFDFRTSKENPNIIVKELKLEKLKEYGILNPKGVEPAFGKDANVESQVKRLNDYYRRMIAHPELSRFVPKTQLVIGNNEKGKKTIFAISERIVGEKYNEVLSLPTEEEKENLIIILNGIIDLFIETYDGERGQVAEFAPPNNMMRGKNYYIDLQNNKDKVYLVDLFPVFSYTIQELREQISQFIRRNRLSPEVLRESNAKLKILELKKKVDSV